MEANGDGGNFLDVAGPIGLFGGTFDPPHLGHLWVAAAARDYLGLERVVMLVAPDPWQKTSSRAVSTNHHNRAMDAATTTYGSAVPARTNPHRDPLSSR